MGKNQIKIAIVGAGGVGGYFGARLLESGHDVSFIARGQQLSALNKNGLSIKSPLGNLHLNSVHATSNSNDVGVADYVLVAVKAWQLEESIESIRPLVGKNSCIVPLLNGVDAPEYLSNYFDRSQIFGGLCGIFAMISEPGTITHLGGVTPFIRFGELSPIERDRTTPLLNALSISGVNAEVSEDITLAMWKKFLFIAPIGGVSAMSQLTLDVVRQKEETLDLVTSAMQETVDIAQSLGIPLTESDIEKRLKLLDSSPIGATTSMQRDIASKKPSELESQTGAIVRLGLKQRVPTPTNSMLFQTLWPKEREARKRAFGASSANNNLMPNLNNGETIFSSLR